MVILSYERKKRLDRTHIVFNIIAREYGGCHHDSLMWVTIWTPNGTCRTNTKGVRCSSDLFTFCPNFVQHNQMFIRQNRPSVLRSSHNSGLGSNTFYQIQIQIQIHFFPEFQIQIQIQIHRQKSDQIQIQIQIQLIKYKYKYKYTMRPRQNCRHFTDDIFKFIVL